MNTTMTLKKQTNRQHKDVMIDPLYRMKVVESKKRKEKKQVVPKNKLLEEAQEVFDEWVEDELPPWEGEDEFLDEKELQEHKAAVKAREEGT